MRTALILGLLAPLSVLAACASVEAAVKDESYSLPRGVASYDSLAREGAACKARGGTVKPTGQGDTTMLSNYVCSITAGAAK
jgi:hypothetical protein